MCDVDRRPTAVGYKAFLLISSTWTAFGLVPLPGSLASGPDIYAQTSAFAIWFGCLISLVGLLWRGRRSTGFIIEQTGLVFMAAGCAMYAAALLTVHLDAAIAAWTGWASFTQVIQVLFADILIAFGMSGGIALAAVLQFRAISRYRKAARRGEPYDV